MQAYESFQGLKDNGWLELSTTFIAMQKLNIPAETSFSELPFDQFNELKYALYVLDDRWNYLFVNDFVNKNLRLEPGELIGMNMWQRFRELATDPAFIRMRTDMEKGNSVNFVTTSPINSQRLNIVGYSLKDCYFFYASQLPNKDEILNELRSALRSRQD